MQTTVLPLIEKNTVKTTVHLLMRSTTLSGSPFYTSAVYEFDEFPEGTSHMLHYEWDSAKNLKAVLRRPSSTDDMQYVAQALKRYERFSYVGKIRVVIGLEGVWR